MPHPRPCVLVVMFAIGTSAWAGEARGQQAHAQRTAAPNEAPASRWALGLSAGLWGRVPVASSESDGGSRNGAFDIDIQRSVGRRRGASMWAIRVQVGRGSGHSRREGFDYRRVIVGAIREFSYTSQSPFRVHVVAGGGAYRVDSADARETRRGTKSSLFGGLGFDGRLGSSPLSLGAELQVHTIGDLLYGTTSIVARIRLP